VQPSMADSHSERGGTHTSRPGQHATSERPPYIQSHDPAACRRAQKRFAGMTCEMLEAWLDGRPFEVDNYIVREGRLAPQYT